jgi:hypothetical protein
VALRGSVTRGVEPVYKMTKPDGKGGGGDGEVTCTLKVTESPKLEGFSEEVRVVTDVTVIVTG